MRGFVTIYSSSSENLVNVFEVLVVGIWSKRSVKVIPIAEDSMEIPKIFSPSTTMLSLLRLDNGVTVNRAPEQLYSSEKVAWQAIQSRADLSIRRAKRSMDSATRVLADAETWYQRVLDSMPAGYMLNFRRGQPDSEVKS